MHAHLDTSAFTGETIGYVSMAAVTAAAAGSGIGRRLMSAAEEWARQQGCALMTLEVFARNTAARVIYARLGYAEQTLKLAKPLPPTATGGEEPVMPRSGTARTSGDAVLVPLCCTE